MYIDKLLTEYGLPVMLAAFMLYMAFIVYRLAKDSNAGKWGMFVLYLGLAVGLLGFALKFVIKFFLDQSL